MAVLGVLDVSSFCIGVDVGGTYTDLVSVDGEGHTIFVKSPSTPRDQSIGVMAGLEKLAARHALSLNELLGRTERVVHGSTVAVNALLERKGARVALLTTEGHRDVLEMREGLKSERYNLRMPPIEPLVPRDLRYGIRERLKPDGSISVPLDLDSIDSAIASMEEKDVAAVAVCFLHAYENPEHEVRTLERVKQKLPSVYVSASSDVFPQIKEYERFSTTVVNAYVGPVVHFYLTNLQRRLLEAGLSKDIFIILSHGGMAPVEEAARLAAATIFSGPAGGIAGSRQSAELLDAPNLVPFDMGGTSTDVSVIADFQVPLSTQRELAGERIALRSLDIASVGAGGGTIARVDSVGTLMVGPESAGAEPGPACYSGGGTAATVTDANVVLGYLNPASFLGGSQPLDKEAAEAALDRLAAQLSLDRIEAAAGVYRMINLKMADGIRMITLRQGLDPRHFVLLSSGGAAGLHAVEVARELEIPRVVVPTVASVFSAWGMLTTDLRYELSRTYMDELCTFSDGRIREIYQEIEDCAADRLSSWFDGPLKFERWAEMRYGEQIYEIDVALGDLDWQAGGLVDRVQERFHNRHEELYTYASKDSEVVFVNARVAGIGEIDAAPYSAGVRPDSPPPKPASRRAWLGQWLEVPSYKVDQLSTGQTFLGPGLFEADTTTVLINDGDLASVNGLGWLDIQLRESPASD